MPNAERHSRRDPTTYTHRKIRDAEPEDRAPLEHQKPVIMVRDELGRLVRSDELARRYLAATAPRGWDAER